MGKDAFILIEIQDFDKRLNKGVALSKKDAVQWVERQYKNLVHEKTEDPLDEIDLALIPPSYIIKNGFMWHENGFTYEEVEVT